MLRALYTASTGMEAQQLKVDVIANNLANVSTVGFKKSRGDFQELLYETLRGPGLESSVSGTQVPTGVQVGLGVRTVAVSKMHEQGSLTHTGNDLDVGIEGAGFFQIVRPNGQIAYTRAGDFKLNADGQIVTPDGLLLEPQVTVPEDTITLEISADGVVSAIQQGNPDPLELGQIEISNFVNPAGLLSLGRNLYEQTAASGSPLISTPGEDGLGTLGQGFLEQSNVKVVDEMVNMIVGQRAYEMSSKAIQASDQMLKTVSNLR